MTRIRYKHPNNGVTQRRIHLLHQQDLVLSTMLGALRESQEAEGEDDLPEITRMYDQWSIDELMKFGVVSLYHLWERQTKSLIEEQLVKVPKDKQKSQDGVVGHFFEVLANELNAPVAPVHRASLNECRQLTNALKHDTGDVYESLSRDYPVYFVAGPEPAEQRFRVTPALLEDLFTRVGAFWDELDKFVLIDHRQ